MVLKMMAPPSDGRLSVFGRREFVLEDSLVLLIDKKGGEYHVIKGEKYDLPILIARRDDAHDDQLVIQNADKTLAARLQIERRHDLWDWEVSAYNKQLHSKKIFSALGNHTEVKVSLDGVGFQIKRQGDTCIIYYEKNSTDDIGDILSLDGGNFLVGVRPNVDLVFVATLSVMVDFMKRITEPEGSPPVMGQPVSCSDVIGREYISEGVTKLEFKKAVGSAAGEYTVALGQKEFTLKSHNNLQMILDEELKLIAQLSKKTFTLHSRWEVSSFGEGKAGKIVCSVCRHYMIQVDKDDIHLDVTLEKETEKRSHAAVIKVKGSWEKKDFTIYKKDSMGIIADMMPLDNDEFMVKVHAGVDCAFVVSLIAVLLAMKTKSFRTKKAVKRFLKIVGAFAVSGFHFGLELA